ncbi:HPr family phosphocarrier protein [bacterium]|nr:MAG: HPr family phosphocarrier protein [bacterium]
MERELQIINKLGLHARPAMLLVKTASKFQSSIKLVKDNVEANAKSIMGVLVLAAEKGSKIKILVDGPDEEEALEAIAKLFADGFGEE